MQQETHFWNTPLKRNYYIGLQMVVNRFSFIILQKPVDKFLVQFIVMFTYNGDILT